MITEFHEDIRYDYPLNENSSVIDCGFYEGDFTKRIWEKYRCWITAYEPINRLYNLGHDKVGVNWKIALIHSAVGNSNRSERFHVKGSMTGPYADGETEEVQVVPLNIAKAVDLLKLNIEGMEFEVLEHLISEGTARLCHNIQVQFHGVVPDAQKRYQAIRDKLLETHEFTYCFPWCWENYRLK